MKYIKGYDSLRAVSIILVLSSHLGLYALLPQYDYIQERIWPIISGTTGVQIFFTLSGFLITKILIAEKGKYNSIDFKNFYIRRFLRLLPPLVIFYVAILFLMNAHQIASTKIGFLYSIFYLYNFVPKTYYTSELGHTWSLALEEQFYIIWPILIHFIQKKKMLLRIITLMIILCFVSYYVLDYFKMNDNYYMMRFFIPAVAPILIGSYFSILLQSNLEKWKNFFHENKKIFIYSILLFIFPLYGFAFLLKFAFIFQSIGIGLFLSWIFFNQESRTTTVLNKPILNFIGKISYGIYVYQGLFLTTGPSGELWIQQFPQNILLTVGIAILSYFLLEQPILKMKKHFVRSK